MMRSTRVPSRVVFDTSTLVSAALRKGSIPWQALVYATRFSEVCASRQTLDELRDVMNRSKFDRYLNAIERERFVSEFESRVRLVVVPEDQIRETNDALLLPQCRDGKDQKFLDLAHAAEAEWIIASDDDLLVLSPWNDIPIMRPSSFLKAMEE